MQFNCLSILLADDIATVRRAIDHIGGPVTLVGHSYGGFVITNDAVKIIPTSQDLFILSPLLQIRGQSLSNFVDVTKFPKDFLILDSGGFVYINPDMFHVSLCSRCGCD